VEVREKSQWDFVLEEMAWLANDFAQERLWKMTAATQICHRVALTCQLRFEERNQHRKLKKIASVLSYAILQFWSSVEAEVPGELEETSLGIVKVFDCLTSFMVFDDNDDHMVLSFSFKLELCIYIYIR
jgi:hypothetical protein